MQAKAAPTYVGARVSDVWTEIKSNPYKTLPQEKVSVSKFFSWGVNLLERSAKRTIAADKILDLTHTLSPTFPIWPGNEPIKLTNKGTFAKIGKGLGVRYLVLGTLLRDTKTKAPVIVARVVDTEVWETKPIPRVVATDDGDRVAIDVLVRARRLPTTS